VQRRHQKVLEEAPAPGLAPDLRRELLEAAVAFCRAIGYRSAGTVEFVLDGHAFFFLELNGRIQVEHPVTEAVTGLDLIAEQLRIAEGGAIATSRSEVEGHAVEVRLYAEDPSTFLPQTGRLERLRLPSHDVSRGIRVDAGVEEGDEVGLGYDPMIAKLVAHGRDRADALERLSAALAETEIAGVTTNLPFLRWLVAHPVVRSGEATTAFLVEHPPLSPPPLRVPDAVWRHPWRLNLPAPAPARPPDVDVEAQSQAAALGGSSTVTAPMPGTVLSVEVEPGDEIEARRALVVLEAMKMEIPVHAPFGGKVATVHVAAGDRVAGGAPLVELES
jgi:acetyl/propionyl-CoA carboxylase alpha subunit